MRISELSRTSGVSVASIKYYLREGLLSPGSPIASNQAEYGDQHVHRLRLIRVLVNIGGLSIADVRSVVAAIEDPSLPLHEMLGAGHRLLGPRRQNAVSEETRAALAEVDQFVERRDWRVSRDAPSRRILADALLSLRHLGWEVGPDAFERYADAADRLAAHEVERTPTQVSRAELVEYVVVGTVVFEEVLGALRRMAQEHYSAERFGRSSPALGRLSRR